MENVSCSDSSFCEFMYFKTNGRGCNFVGYCSFQRPLVPIEERKDAFNHPEIKITVRGDVGEEFSDEEIDKQTDEIIRSYKTYQEAIKENGSSVNFIPPLTTDLTKTWEQPSREKIHFKNGTACMDGVTFENLNNYSSCDPKGLHVGKIWRRWVKEDSLWYLCWYVQDGKETIASRPIEITL